MSGPLRVGLVGCGKAKRDGRHPARSLYTGALFRMALAYAESRCDVVYVVSAGHFLVELDRELDSYDARMPGDAFGKRRWGKLVECRLRLNHLQDRRCVPLAILALAGAGYVDPVREAAGRNPWTFVEPLRGMGIGHRLAWLSERLKQSATVPGAMARQKQGRDKQINLKICATEKDGYNTACDGAGLKLASWILMHLRHAAGLPTPLTAAPSKRSRPVQFDDERTLPLNFRATSEEKDAFCAASDAAGFDSLADWIRLHLGVAAGLT